MGVRVLGSGQGCSGLPYLWAEVCLHNTRTEALGWIPGFRGSGLQGSRFEVQKARVWDLSVRVYRGLGFYGEQGLGLRAFWVQGFGLGSFG